ncbi:Os06g0205511 [Oryza sativa Japonica Group]|jgi:hypothetical protein|uniref:Os06g0205511 protein n=3 Tax=Oryza TaxID=4527 RepID=Q69NN8_ORYSJ|nr:hypothetical protein [Oryza sativa Japonica Group]BAS96694.1 Os06g0205511 [Oryza sativa Japonica Group]
MDVMPPMLLLGQPGVEGRWMEEGVTASASQNLNRRRDVLAPVTMSFLDDKDDKAFLLALAPTKEAAVASSDSKSRRLYMTSSPTSTSPPLAAVLQGSYLIHVERRYLASLGPASAPSSERVGET